MRRALALVALMMLACGRPAPRAVSIPKMDGAIAARTTPDEKFRSTLPLATLAPAAAPKVHEGKLKNGIRVLFVERHDAPVIALRIVSDRGADQADNGIAQFWSRAVLQASDSRPYWEVNEATNGLGLTVSADVTHDETIVGFRVLSKLFAPAAELVGDLVAHPSFPKSRLTLVRQRLRASLTASYSSAEGQMLLGLHYALFPPTHRYADPFAPPDSIDKVNADILSAYHRYALTPLHTTIAVAGDTTIDALLPVLESNFGSLAGPKVGAQLPPAAPTDAATQPEIIFIGQETGSQAHVAAAWLAPESHLPDRFDFLIAAETFEHEVQDELRVKQGITYGMHIFSGPMRGRVPFGVNGSVEIAHVGDAVQSLLAIAKKLSTEPLAADALADGKVALVGSRAYFESIAKTADTLAFFSTYGYPLDYPVVRAAAIGACTADSVRLAAERWLAPSRMRIVVIGDPAAIAPQLKKLTGVSLVRRPIAMFF